MVRPRAMHDLPDETEFPYSLTQDAQGQEQQAVPATQQRKWVVAMSGLDIGNGEIPISDTALTSSLGRSARFRSSYQHSLLLGSCIFKVGKLFQAERFNKRVNTVL
jgi:hypothetical protein